MHTLSLSKTLLLVEHVAIRLNEPVMIHGQPGAGKSEGIDQLSRKYGATRENHRFVDIRLSQYDSVDLRGMPDLDKKLGLTTWYPPATLPFKGNKHFAGMENDVIVVFFDEINSATAAVSAVAYQLINDRRVGEHELMDNVRIVAAGNRDSDRGVTNRMPTPLANRFTHVEVVVSVEDVTTHYTETGKPPVGIAFLNFRPAMLNTFDPTKPDKAFATPRTWTKALRYYADATMPEDVKMSAMAGAVGAGPAAEFWGFVDVWQKVIPISKIIADPMGVEVPTEASMLYATAVNVSGNMTKQTVPQLHKFLQRLSPEFVVLAWKLAMTRDDSISYTPEFVAFSSAYTQIVRN